MKYIAHCALAALACGSFATAASAADLPSKTYPPVLAPVVADSFQPFQIQVLAAGVIAQNGGSLNTVAGGASVSDGFKASTAVIPEVTLSYFFTKNISAQLMCCFSAHSVSLKGGALDGTQVAHTWLFPPTLLLQYHVTELGAFQPYAGVGVNYTHYFSVNPNYTVLNNAYIKDSWGVAGQVGFDYMLNEHWGINVDLKKIMMQPRVDANLAGTGTAIHGKADLSPWIVGAGLTYRFGGAAPAVVARY